MFLVSGQFILVCSSKIGPTEMGVSGYPWHAACSLIQGMSDIAKRPRLPSSQLLSTIGRPLVAVMFTLLGLVGGCLGGAYFASRVPSGGIAPSNGLEGLASVLFFILYVLIGGIIGALTGLITSTIWAVFWPRRSKG